MSDHSLFSFYMPCKFYRPVSYLSVFLSVALVLTLAMQKMFQVTDHFSTFLKHFQCCSILFYELMTVPYVELEICESLTCV